MSPDQIAELAKQGLLGVLLLAAIGAIIYLYKGRMSDWKEVGQFLRDHTVAMRDWINVNEPRNRALEANVRALELLTLEVTSLKNEIVAFRDVLSDRSAEALKSNRDMREVVLALKEQIVAIYNRCTRGL